MPNSVTIQPEAKADIQEAARWYEDQETGLGRRFMDAVAASLAIIKRYPQAYPVVYKQARRAILKRFPYGIYYLLEHDKIIVFACFHGSRNPRSWQRRL